MDSFGGDIVNYVKDGFETPFGEVLDVVFKRCDGGLILAVFDWCGEDGVCRPVVEDKNGHLAVDRSDKELAGRIDVDRAVPSVDAAVVAEEVILGGFFLGRMHVA